VSARTKYALVVRVHELIPPLNLFRMGGMSWHQKCLWCKSCS